LYCYSVGESGSLRTLGVGTVHLESCVLGRLWVDRMLQGIGDDPQEGMFSRAPELRCGDSATFAHCPGQTLPHQVNIFTFLFLLLSDLRAL
jgi:hypothetical protein